jgi:UDP-4-amino-4-deoxy-L-arabinose formyltransferase/UDP-glucuronic acid dehydrogenase (UDP-4-keto-hexauronic acid decarboxylating)
MRVAIIGRSEILYDMAVLLKRHGNVISCILTAMEAPEYTRTAADFQALAHQWRIPFAQGPRIVDHLDFLKASASDISVSINYPGVVPQEVIDLFPLGILNAHGGDLPRYRGNACQAWAILNGEERIGLCIHRMIGGELDSGDIIARDYLPIDLTTKVTQAWSWMVERSPALMLEAVQQLGADPKYILEKQSKDPALALRCYPRRPEDARIDWNKPAVDVLRLINACNKPYAGAFCFYEKTKAIIWDAEIEEDKAKFCAVPGQILRFDETTASVACKIGSIRIKHLEINKKSIRPHQIKMTTRKRFS